MIIQIDVMWLLVFLIIAVTLYSLEKNLHFFSVYGPVLVFIGGIVLCIVFWILVIIIPDLGWKAIFGMGAGLLTFLYLGFYFATQIDDYQKKHPHTGDYLFAGIIGANYVIMIYAFATGSFFGLFNLGVGVFGTVMVKKSWKRTELKKLEEGEQ